MHVFRADGAAVSLLKRLDEVAELHGLFAERKRAYVKGFLEIGFSQIVERRVQIRDALLLPQAQRIEIRVLVATEAIGVNKLQDFNLLRIRVRVGNRGRVT